MSKIAFDKDASSYIYVVVRKDLPVCHQAPQAIHASMKASQAFPLKGEERLVFLSIENKEKLLHMKAQLDMHGVPYEEFHEPDHNHGLTSLCTAPIPNCTLFKKLKLWHPLAHEQVSSPQPVF